MKVLIIKISSMGDVIHTLPAIHDAKSLIPDIKFDWVVEPAFAEIPTWHPAVNRVIHAPLRKWKKNKVSAIKNGEIKHLIQTLRNTKYDLIIDAQSAIKSALIGKIAYGKLVGMDKNSVREYGAHWIYKQKYFVDKQQHAIARIRQLFSQTLNYKLPLTNQNFGIDKNLLPPLKIKLPENFIFCAHSTTWSTKHWPITHWQKIIKYAEKKGLFVLLPWGTAQEKQRAEIIAKSHTNAQVLPRLSLGECASVISKAQMAICVDTGLGHLAAALNIPAIHLYGPTDPQKIGAYGDKQIILSSKLPCANLCKKKCFHVNCVDEQSACLSALTPEIVAANMAPEL